MLYKYLCIHVFELVVNIYHLNVLNHISPSSLNNYNVVLHNSIILYLVIYNRPIEVIILSIITCLTSLVIIAIMLGRMKSSPMFQRSSYTIFFFFFFVNNCGSPKNLHYSLIMQVQILVYVRTQVLKVFVLKNSHTLKVSLLYIKIHVNINVPLITYNNFHNNTQGK